MKEVRTAHDPHPLSPDDPGYLGTHETYGLGSRYVNAQFAMALKRAGHIKQVPAEIFSASRAKRNAMPTPRGRR